MTTSVSNQTVEGMPVKLLTSCVQVEYAPGRTKLISYEDFLESMKLVTETNPDRASGNLLELFLPDNTFYFAQTASQIKVCCFYPEHVVPLQYGDETSPIPRLLPNMIISFILLKTPGQGSVKYTLPAENIYFLATKMGKMELPRKFYGGPHSGEAALLPVSNLYDSARLCYGSNLRVSEFKLPDLRPLVSYYHTLTGSPFNDDLGVKAIRGAFTTSGWFAEMARLAKTKSPFPYATIGL